MADNQTAKDRILRVISAICTDGFTSSWIQGSRGYESRDHFYFDKSTRMQILSGSPEAFVMHVETRRTNANDKASPKTLPDSCDWSLQDIVDYIQQLDDDDIDNLPQPQMSNKSVRLMSNILDTIDYGTWHTISGTSYQAVENVENDPEYQDIVILTDRSNPFDDQWGAERFFEQGRNT